jgi:uracil permease
MEKPKYIYDIDDHPPLRYGLVYGLQWAVIMFPVLIIVAKFAGQLCTWTRRRNPFFPAHLDGFGFFSAVQSLWDTGTRFWTDRRQRCF